MSEKKPTKTVADEYNTVVLEESQTYKPYIEPTIYLVESVFMENPNKPLANFSGIPVTTNCPYVEIIFDPDKKILGVISKHVKQTIQSITKLDTNGFPKETTNKKFKEQFPFQQERLLMETYHEYYIRNEKEIDNFLSDHVINKDFDWNAYMK